MGCILEHVFHLPLTCHLHISALPRNYVNGQCLKENNWKTSSKAIASSTLLYICCACYEQWDVADTSLFNSVLTPAEKIGCLWAVSHENITSNLGLTTLHLCRLFNNVFAFRNTLDGFCPSFLFGRAQKLSKIFPTIHHVFISIYSYLHAEFGIFTINFVTSVPNFGIHCQLCLLSFVLRSIFLDPKPVK